MKKSQAPARSQKFVTVLPAFGWSVLVSKKVKDVNDEEMITYGNWEIIAWGVTASGEFVPITCGRDGPGLLPDGERDFRFRRIG